MASVLVIAVDLNIESLVGELVAFAGHRPIFDATAGAAGESVRRFRPDVALLDTALSPAVLDGCLSACAEVGARPVLMSSTSSELDLAHRAEQRGCLYFALPSGPKALDRIIARATRRDPLVVTARPTTAEHASVHPALCAALARVARARALSLQARAPAANSLIRADAATAAADARRSLHALRAAIADYALHLKAEAVPADRALEIVTTVLADCASIVGAEQAVEPLLSESKSWALEAYEEPPRLRPTDAERRPEPNA